MQPRRMIEGSSQVVVAEVEGPVPLEGPVRIIVGDVSGPARWEGEPGQHRRCGATLRPSAGVHRVLVRLESVESQVPLLEAGRIVVARR